jgi:hypothetical protein
LFKAEWNRADLEKRIGDLEKDKLELINKIKQNPELIYKLEKKLFDTEKTIILNRDMIALLDGEKTSELH